MVFLDFLRRYPKNRFDVLHFNHGTQYCDEAESFVKAKCAEFGIECHVGRIGRRRAKGESQEEYWARKLVWVYRKLLTEGKTDLSRNSFVRTMNIKPGKILQCLQSVPKYAEPEEAKMIMRIFVGSDVVI